MSSAVLPGLDSLRGKVVVVTGGARGQGAAEARLFRDLGSHVVAADVLDEPGEALAADLGEAVDFQHLDVTDEAAWRALVDATVGRHGRIDVLVNNAGVFRKATLDEWSADELRRLIDVNLVGTILGIQAVAPAMPSGGAIVNIASTAGIRGYAGSLPYSASKWGVRGVSRSAALELAPRGIRVNCVCPGAVDTPMIDPTAFDVRRLPIARAGSPTEIAATVAFLASDAGGYCTGAEVVVDGGANA
jgi:3alpha(or 20beta)-hydroxysteroid dehydrogenase